MLEIKIGSNTIGEYHPTYFIAEIGSNFDGSLAKAKELIELAAKAGANAVKFQHYTAETLVSDYNFGRLQRNISHQSDWTETVFKVYDNASIVKEWTAELKTLSDKFKVDFMTSPYSMELVDYVENFVAAFKVGSGDVNNHDIIKQMAKKNKPIFIATGASTMGEVETAYEQAREINDQIILLQCNTNYTADDNNYKHLNLRVINSFKENFPDALVGLSDHMPGHIEVLGAVALGANVIEKHFTDDTEKKGPDHSFALNPNNFREMVENVRKLEAALGNGIKRLEANERDTVIVQRRALCVARDLPRGHTLRVNDLISLRPRTDKNFSPSEKHKIIGKQLDRPFAKHESISKHDIN